MADAFEDQIAEAVVAELNASTRSWDAFFEKDSVTAFRTRAPWYGDDPKEIERKSVYLKELKVAVVPLTIKRARLSRAAKRQLEYGIGIDLQRMCEPTDDTLLKELSTVAEQMHDFFDDGHFLATLTSWQCMEAERADVYNLPLLYTERTWETLIVVQVRGYRT